jgi:2-polyprenyl-6-methoxyphenol hydroxylase-like FAD-dependent oxidoreductase
MLPYLAQGANSAIEDGAVLGLLLGNIGSVDEVPQALRMYEQLRKTRGEAIVKETFKQVSSSTCFAVCLSLAPFPGHFGPQVDTLITMCA